MNLLLSIDPVHPEEAILERAADVLRQGGLVAFPTETVYGLGANALDERAVARIFAAKGRPSANPVIVHAANLEAARQLVSDWPAEAQRLAEAFWPGPLTLVLPKASCVPDVVSAGGPTVGIRVPAHPVALGLLRAARLPIAAPSANASTQLSPTRAEHVLAGLEGRVDLILDGGACSGGLESTVVDLAVLPPRLLRPGLIGLPQLETIIGPVEVMSGAKEKMTALRSPGLLARHYSPRTPLQLSDHISDDLAACRAAGKRTGLIAMGMLQSREAQEMIELPIDPAGYAAALYAALHAMDAKALDVILVQAPPRNEEWRAVHDRLQRASVS